MQWAASRTLLYSTVESSNNNIPHLNHYHRKIITVLY